ncbi:MAG: hypothetical protein MZV65_02045 [Chromatiales bacterium]|nr:hypothetical protein [Chromatiales bacterium]
MISLFLIMTIAQISLSSIGFFIFKNKSIDIISEAATEMINFTNDLSSLSSSNIFINNNDVLLNTDNQERFYRFEVPNPTEINNTNNNQINMIYLSKEKLQDELIKIVMNLATILVISILIFLEFLILIFKLFESRFDKLNNKIVKAVHYSYMRPAIFLFVFGIDLSMSFIPLYMENIYTPILGLSKDIVMGLPVSAEFLCVGIAILVSGIWLDRRGWHEPL